MGLKCQTISKEIDLSKNYNINHKTYTKFINFLKVPMVILVFTRISIIS